MPVTEGTMAANRTAAQTRAEALAQAKRLSDEGRLDEALPHLIGAMMRQPAVAKIRLWQLDSMLFGVSRGAAIAAVHRARRLAGAIGLAGGGDGTRTLGWALESPQASVRMTAWLIEVSKREGLLQFRPPDGFPFGLLYAER